MNDRWQWGAHQPKMKGEGGATGVQRPRSKRRFFRVMMLVLLLSAALSSGLWFAAQNSIFPKVAPGLYRGTLVTRGGREEARDFALEISEDYKKMRVYLFGVDAGVFPAQRDISGFLRIDATREPLILRGVRKIDKPSTQTLEGDWIAESSGKVGDWKLERSEILPVNTSDALNEWLAIGFELALVQGEIETLERSVPIQKTEIEELSRLIVDEDALKNRGKDRESALAQEREKLLAQVAAERKQLIDAEAQRMLSMRLSPRGKLVELGREIAERETRWFRARLALSNGTASSGASVPTEEVRQLAETIQREKRLVDELVAKLDRKPVASGTEEYR